MASYLQIKVMSKCEHTYVSVYTQVCFLLYPNIEIHMTSMNLCSEKCENNWFGINKVTDI